MTVRRNTQRCSSCEGQRKRRWAAQLGRFSAESAARRRAAGVNVRISPMVSARRVARIAANQQAARDWRAGAPRRGADPERFRRNLALRTTLWATSGSNRGPSPCKGDALTS
jgi:hypothetical protein